jgi:hypothetical protein
MNRFRVLTVFIYPIVLCCSNPSAKYHEQTEIVKELLVNCSKNDTSAVKNMIGVKLEDVGLDNETLIWNVNRANKLLKEYGMPSENNFILKEYEERNPQLLDVTVPILKNGKGKLKDAEMTISFVKYLPPTKILDFSIKTTYETIPIKPTEPAPLDSTNISK